MRHQRTANSGGRLSQSFSHISMSLLLAGPERSVNMTLEGGCYCGKVLLRSGGESRC